MGTTKTHVVNRQLTNVGLPPQNIQWKAKETIKSEHKIENMNDNNYKMTVMANAELSIRFYRFASEANYALLDLLLKVHCSFLLKQDLNKNGNSYIITLA